MSATIQLVNVSKRYRLGGAPLSLKSMLRQRSVSEEDKYHWAVRDINFSLQRGEALGIIGPNGAGKTTILKLLSKVTFPTSGQIDMNGRFSALIELGAGFHPDLTGRENVYLNGTILGMRRSEIENRFDAIVAFAGIEKFIDTPVKRYSSGMYARLGFAVAAHVDPEILLVDEVLAVGDMAFQRRCYDRMLEMIRNGTTLIFVSHNMHAIQRVCSRCMVLYRGEAAYEGTPAEATAEYSNILRKAAQEHTTEADFSDGIAERVMTHKAVIEKVEMLSESGNPVYSVRAGDSVRVRAHVRFAGEAQSPVFACAIRQTDGQVAYDFTTHWAGIDTPTFQAGTQAIIDFHIQVNLAQGTYHLGVNLAYQDLSKYYDRNDRAMDFVVSSRNGSRGVADLNARFEVVEVLPQGDHAAVLR
jgi:lipopolysaccharide transport system ATP-binding protein